MTKVREEGYKDTDIISMSEEYFQLADKMVDAAENCSQRYATQINQIEKALIVIMILIVALLIKESVEQVVLSKKNRELRKKLIWTFIPVFRTKAAARSSFWQTTI